ncbi:bcl2-associated agonist of cell death [Varanus komodoensis]|uniref:Bcl2-associated agonist of cell death n=1 Tax=Varanus komodoensis TaxID=61221 RepID=A0A8D2LLB8_VARKO|nr:bcl2-associated agonist of cell death [Varanus komodoensis]XP_044304719.1 bcl2-associated agonist of cell death [Varanus komodoensis]
MFQIAEYHEDDTFLTGEKEPQDPKLTGRGAAGRNKDPASVASGENSELRRRIGSDPPLPDSEAPDEVGAFRARSRSAPPILWAAQRYGQELRRMSDEFHGALQKLPRPKSAGTATQMRHRSGWKETLQSWWHRSSPGNASPPSSP